MVGHCASGWELANDDAESVFCAAVCAMGAASVDPLRAQLRDSGLRDCGIGDGVQPDPEVE